jgi:hypothetical protein
MGLLGGIGKFIFGGPSKTSKTQTKGTSDYDPWSPVIPYLEDYLGKTRELYGQAPMISPYEQAGYDKLAQTVGQGATAVDPAIAENNKTLSGYYLNPETNPYIADIASRMAGLAQSNANTTFGGPGRTGSGLAGYYAGKGSAEAAGDVYYKNYGDERGRMGSAVGMAPQLEAGRYLGPQALISAGQNISARTFDINQMYGGILGNFATLGQQGQTTGLQTNQGYNAGLLKNIANSFTNKLFGATGG